MKLLCRQWRLGEALCVMGVVCAPAVADGPISMEDPAVDRVVDFGADVLPLLKRNCLACHSATMAEADVVLETPEQIRAERAGGALAVPGDWESSRVLRVAAHLDEPIMPPADNEVGAVALTPTELGLIKRWIEQGAKDARASAEKTTIHWQPIPDAHRPILATAVTPAGDMAVCSRGGEVVVYGLQAGAQQGQVLGRLIDSSLDPIHAGPQGAAHLDMVSAVAMHGEADWIATAGYRCVKLWQRHHPLHDVVSTVANAGICAASPDGKLVAVAGDDGSIQVIDLAGEKPAVTWKAHDQSVVGLAFAKGGEALVSASKDGVVRAWQAATGTALAGWRLSVLPKRMVVPADDLLITASDDLSLRVWTLSIPAQSPTEGVATELPTLAPLRAITGHGRAIEALVAVPGSPRQFLSGSVDGTVRLWNADDGSQVNAWIHGDAVTSITAVADGSRFVSVGADRTAKVWTVTATEPVATVQGDYRQSRRVEHLTRMVEVAKANVTDAQAAVQTVEKQLATDQELKTKQVATLEDAKRALSEKTIALNDAKSKHEAGAAALAELVKRRDEAEKAVAAANARGTESEKELELLTAAVKRTENPDELAAATAALEKVCQDRQAFLQIVQCDAQASLDASTKQRDEAQAAQDALAKQVEESQKAFDASSAASKDAETIVSRSDESIVRTTEAVTAAKRHAEERAAKLASQEKLLAEASQQAVDQRPVLATASYSSDGQRLILVATNAQVFVYDAQTFTPLSSWKGELESTLVGMFVNGENVIFLARDLQGASKLTRLDAAPQWKLVRTIGSPDDSTTLLDRVLSLDFSVDGALLATGAGEPSRSGQIAIWNVADGSLVRTIDQPHSDSVFGVAFSPDGEYLASASADRTMKVFRTATGELVRTFEGHTDHVVDVSWRANGKQLATCGADNKIKIWDLALGEQRRTIDAAGKEITSVEFIGTGGTLVSSSGDRNVRIHNADDGAVVRTLSGAADYLFCCAAAETGSMIVAGGADRVLRVWNVADGTELLKLETK